MRELRNAEPEIVSAGAMAPAPRPKLPATLFGVRLSKTDRRVLAAVALLLRPRAVAE
jgi:hypothetical protein